jgi:hypothetical protein
MPAYPGKDSGRISPPASAGASRKAEDGIEYELNGPQSYFHGLLLLGPGPVFQDSASSGNPAQALTKDIGGANGIHGFKQKRKAVTPIMIRESTNRILD